MASDSCLDIGRSAESSGIVSEVPAPACRCGCRGADIQDAPWWTDLSPFVGTGTRMAGEVDEDGRNDCASVARRRDAREPLRDPQSPGDIPWGWLRISVGTRGQSAAAF